MATVTMTTVADGGRVSPAVVRWAAEQIIRMHVEAPPHTIEPGADVPQCARCMPEGGCALLMWGMAVTNTGEGARR